MAGAGRLQAYPLFFNNSEVVKRRAERNVLLKMGEIALKPTASSRLLGVVWSSE